MSSNTQRLFGTDGVRGVANIEPVTAENALRLGRAAAHIFKSNNAFRHHPGTRPKIVLGKDTRLSGYMLENAIVAGVTSLGVDVLLVGPLPTPGVAYITRSLRADAGIVLSASHNPFEDNGIKFFRHDGYKLDDEIERRIEELVFDGEIDGERPTGGEIGRAARIDDALGRYVEFAKQSFPKGMTLERLRIAVDCGNGAAYKSTECALRELGAELHVIHNNPDGTNINANCGSTHPEAVLGEAVRMGADVGISHDGDADRVLLCDENGEVVDGDEILAITAIDALEEGRLVRNTLVATLMSNFGLDDALASRGGRVVRTKVGDRHVIAEMMRGGFNIGGEQSGHMIFHDFTTTGDGLISALQVLRIMVETGKPLSELKRCLTKFPQAQRSVKVREKPEISEIGGLPQLTQEVEQALDGNGRVLVRYSGTEPKLRLLIEGRDQELINRHADRMAEAIREAIGA